MTRLLRSLLLIGALLFSQHAALLHGLEHAGHEAALASHGDGEEPVLGHGRDVCAAFDALAHALGMAGAPIFFAAAAVEVFATPLSLISPAVPRAAFDPRAPPRSA